MKRVFSIVMVGAVTVPLIVMGCGKSSPKTKPKTAKTEPAPTKTPASDKTATDKKTPPDKVKKTDPKAPTGKAAPTAVFDPDKPLAPGVDWIKVTKETDADKKPKTPKKGKVKPEDIAMTGIPKPIKGFSLVKPAGLFVAYGPLAKPQYKVFQDFFKTSRYFERTTEGLNKLFKINSYIAVHLTSCGQANAFWNPSGNRIILCYEMLEQIGHLLKPSFKNDNNALGNAILGVFTHIFWHEAGHMFRDIFDLPLTGKEEDAVDQLATLILLDIGDQGAVSALMAASYWDQMAKRRKQNHYWGTHSLDKQRFYSIACLIFGSNPQKYIFMVNRGILPKQRAVRCVQEYRQLGSAWSRLLKPHRRLGASTANVKLPAPDLGRGGGTAPPRPKTKTPEQPANTKVAACQRATTHVMMHLVNKLKRETPAAKLRDPKFQAQVKQLIIRYGKQILQECVAKWSPQILQCVTQSKNLAQTLKCK